VYEVTLRGFMQDVTARDACKNSWLQHWLITSTRS